MIKCAATNKGSGKPCARSPSSGKKFCSIHDPDNAKAFEAGRSKGGRNPDPPEVPRDQWPTDLAKMRDFIARTMIEARAAQRFGDVATLANCQRQVLKQLKTVTPEGELTDDDIGDMSDEEIERYLEEKGYQPDPNELPS